MKLKTLKDKEDKWINSDVSQPMKDAILQFNHELKAEAIKWVKEARKFEDECVDREDFRTAKFHGGYARGLTTFLNITEEDLK